MKSRFFLVSNSSSTSFVVDTKPLDKEMYDRLCCILSTHASDYAPEFEDKNLFYVTTGMSDGNVCLYNWWVLKKWFADHNIVHTDDGAGTPDPEQKVSDFVMYITEKDDKQEIDWRRARDFRDWLLKDIPNKRIEHAAEKIGLTKEEIKNNKFNLEYYEDMLKEDF